MRKVGAPHTEGAGFRVQGSGRRVQGSGFRVQGAECRVQGAGLTGLRANFQPMTDRLSITISAGSPLHPYGIAYRRSCGLIGFE